jgi:hypothetical protein
MEHTSPQQLSLSQQEALPILKMADVGSLEQLLHGYYLTQIKKIKNRKERKLARRLIENHLVLPKSRQRTSKDAAYIREVLGIERPLLNRLEALRLLRRLSPEGGNPIYEISHDSLVEPILAARRNREAIALFIKKYGKYFLLLLLLLFGAGMVVENTFDLMDDSLAFRSAASDSEEVALPPAPSTYALHSQNDIYAGLGSSQKTLTVPFGEIERFRNSDSLTLLVQVGINRHPIFDQQDGPDTLALDLGAIPLALPVDLLEALVRAQKDTALPLAAVIPVGKSASQDPAELMARVRGTALLRLQAAEPGAEMASRGMDGTAMAGANLRTRGGAQVLRADFGQDVIQMQKNARRIRLDTTLALADLVPDDQVARDVLKGRSLRLTYQVDIQPTPPEAPQTVVEYMPVSGIEVQFIGWHQKVPTRVQRGTPGAQDPHRSDRGDPLQDQQAVWRIRSHSAQAQQPAR